jgi:outer membrane protein assembly factor BamB
MILYRHFTVIFLLLISSCSNLLTWHLDKGIHRQANLEVNESSNKIIDNNVSSKIDITVTPIWSKSVNSGIKGNSAYLHIKEINNILYTIDTNGLLSAIDLNSGNIKWSVPTNREISSGLSIVNDSICLGTASAKLICHEIDSLASNKHTPLITSLVNFTKYSEYPADVEVDLITELAAPIISINNLFLLKLDNDDLYLIDPNDSNVIWKSESQNIPLRTKGASKPLYLNNTVFIARDNGSISSYSATDGTLNWFTIISSRSGRNDLESQRDAEMQISIDNEKLYYGHFQGELTALDRNTGNIIWTSPFSFINDIIINDNSIYGSTSDKELVSIDQASGFLNWRSKISSEQFTQPFIIEDLVMAFTTQGTLVAFKKDGTNIYEEKFDLDLHPQTKFILDGNKLYFQTLDGDIVHFVITI